MKKTFLLAAALLLFVPGKVKAQTEAPTGELGFEISKNLEIFTSVYKTLHHYYVDEVDPGKTMRVAIEAMLAAQDPYTNYYPESDMEDVKLQLTGQYGGVGALIMQFDNKIMISEVYEGQPADKAGLKAGDCILAVDGKSTANKTSNDVSDAMRGQAGTQVSMTIERNGQKMDMTLTRKEIKLKAVPYFGLVKDGYGYIKLNEFTQNSANEMRLALSQLTTTHKNLPGVIIDLRGNGGGLMSEAVDIVNLFIPKDQLVVETRGKVASRNIKSRTRFEPIDTKIPVAVLIDNYSASASEIVSGSLQDFDRAVIVGDRSFGKGLVQNVLPLPYNTQMKVTISKYYIPSGRCIQAIDYSKRDKNGKPLPVPDSLRTAFKTSNGRVVYDGLGIEPDVKVEDDYMSGIEVALVSRNCYFEFANEFVRNHATIAPAAEFEITDDIYNEFVAFLAKKNIEYTTYTEDALKDLREVAEEEKFSTDIASSIAALEKQIADSKKQDLVRYRDHIALMLKGELLNRYYYEHGQIEGMLTSDKTLDKAIEVLNDKKEYQRLLKP